MGQNGTGAAQGPWGDSGEIAGGVMARLVDDLVDQGARRAEAGERERRDAILLDVTPPAISTLSPHGLSPSMHTVDQSPPSPPTCR